MLELTINLLPGVAEKERRLKERRQKMILLSIMLGGNSLVTLLFLFLIFHNISLQNNLNELKNKLTLVRQEIALHKPLEDTVKDLKIRVNAVEQLQKKQVAWNVLIETIASYTMKDIQYTSMKFETGKIKIDGIASSLLSLEKNKNALLTAAYSINYTVRQNDTWQKIASAHNFSLEAFLKLHNINDNVPPQAGKTIKIKKPLFSSSKISKMLTNPKSANKIPFSLELSLAKGII